MQNFFKNAKQAIDLAQTAAKEINTAYTQHQATRSRSRSRSRSNDSKKDKKEKQSQLSNVSLKNLARIDNETCFTVARDTSNFYHIVFVEGEISILKIGDQAQAEAQRNILNRFPIVAKSAFHHKILQKFVDQANANPNWGEIHLACLLGLDDAVDKAAAKDALVIVNSATPDKGLLPLHISIGQANLPLSKKLLTIGADLRKCDLATNNCLHYAVGHGWNFVKELHNIKPEQFKEALDQANNDDFTPFHFALKTESPQLIHYLMKECNADSSLVGVDIGALEASKIAFDTVLKYNPKALTGDRPHSTIFHGEFDREYLKIAHLRDPKIIDCQNEEGRTPLHCACVRNDLKRAVDLLAFGARVDLTGLKGNTPLHLASSKNNEPLVKLLLCFESDHTLKNKDGKTASQMCTTAAIAKIFSQFEKTKKSSEAFEPGHDLPDFTKKAQDKTVDYHEQLDSEVREKSLRLLSLDGGGIRGLCMVIMLMRIERETKSERIIDYIDWISGTSTGAIFALSLVEGYSTIDCLRFYLRLKDDVFVGNRPYESATLEGFLKELFGEKTMDQVKSNKRVVLTTTKSDTNPPKLVLIRSYALPEMNTLSIPGNKIKMWKAARCSSAAPTYFTSVDKIYLDGGLIANNPSPDLISDVNHHNMLLEMEGKDPCTIGCLISLGTGRLPEQPIDGVDLEIPKTSGITSLLSNMSTTLMTLKNLKNIFMEQLATSDGAVVERARTWAHSLHIPFYRYTPQLEVECPLNTFDNLEVINLMWVTKLYAESRSQSEIQQIVRLLRAD